MQSRFPGKIVSSFTTDNASLFFFADEEKEYPVAGYLQLRHRPGMQEQMTRLEEHSTRSSKQQLEMILNTWPVWVASPKAGLDGALQRWLMDSTPPYI